MSMIDTTDDELSVESMRDFRTNSKEDYYKQTKRRARSLMKRIGWKTIVLIFSGLAIGFFMGLDQSATVQQTNMDILLEQEGSTTKAGVETTALELLGAVRKSKRLILRQIKEEYGDYASILMDKYNLARIFQQSESSRNKFYRKILQKLLTKQIQPAKKVTITWVSAGDSSAAGAGNLPDDSYTSVMEKTVKETFAFVGLEFEAVRQGIDGYGSGLEASLCMNSLYGQDIDFLSWDFAATDGDQSYRTALWGVRASEHPSHPLLVMLDYKESLRWAQLKRMDGRLGVTLMDLTTLESFRKQYLPDSTRFTHPEQLPPALRFYQCNGASEGIYSCIDEKNHFLCGSETGEQCRNQKFRPNLGCEYQRYHSPWIQGWKEHRLRGRLLGLFLVQQLYDALMDLDATLQRLNPPSHQRWYQMMDVFRQHDSQDEFVAQNLGLPTDVLGQYEESMSDFSKALLEQPATCILPATVVNRLNSGNTDHRHLPENNTVISLTDAQWPSGKCPRFEFGHREAFQVVKHSDPEGFLLNVKPQGEEGSFLLIACFRTCTFSDCYKVMEGLDSLKIANENILIEVDGAQVFGSQEMDSCHFLEGEQGLLWKTKTESHFVVRFQVKEEGGSLLLFSVVAVHSSDEGYNLPERRKRIDPVAPVQTFPADP